MLNLDQRDIKNSSIMKNAKYAITGMTCTSCSSAIERHFSRLEGIATAQVNLLRKELSVVFNEVEVR